MHLLGGFWPLSLITHKSKGYPLTLHYMFPQIMHVRQLPHERDLVTDISVNDYSFRYFCVSPILPLVQLGILGGGGGGRGKRTAKEVSI